MKIRIIVSIIMIFILCGCQATPEKSAVVNKGDNKLQETIQSTPAPTMQVIADTQWIETYNIPNLECDINAHIMLPDTNTFPVYKVAKRTFDLAEMVKIINYLTNGATGVRETSPTKEELEAQLVLTKKGRYVLDDSGGRWEPYNGQQEDIADLEEQIKNAQPEEFNPITAPISLPINNTYKMPNGSRAYLNATEKTISFSTEKYGIQQPESWIIDGDARPGEPAGTTLNNVKISEKVAREKASELISALNIKNMGIAEAEKARIINELSSETITEGWCITLARNDGNSIPFNLDTSKSTGLLDFESEDFAERWFNEKITVFVDETGIRSFFWTNPLEVVEEINSNVPLLPFDDIKNRIKLNIKFGYSKRIQNGQISGPHKLKLESIILINVLVPVKDDLEYQMLLPAWLVSYTSSFETDGIEYEDPIAIFAVNAIDGSSINISMGFHETRVN